MFSSPNVLLLPQRFIPESVRWLLVKGKKEEAREILSNVAKVNKKEMPSEELRVPVTTASKGIFELFKTWNMAKLSLIQCYAWLVMNKASSLNVSSSHSLHPLQPQGEEKSAQSWNSHSSPLPPSTLG